MTRAGRYGLDSSIPRPEREVIHGVAAEGTDGVESAEFDEVGAFLGFGHFLDLCEVGLAAVVEVGDLFLEQVSVFWFGLHGGGSMSFRAKAIAKLNDGTDDKRFFDFAAFAAGSLLGPSERAGGTVFPKVDAAAEPVVGVGTGGKFRF